MQIKERKLGRGVSVVGAGMSKFGVSPDRDIRDVMLEGYVQTLSSVDKGIDPADIQAIYLGNFSSDLFERQTHIGHLIADWIGLAPRPATRIEGACASSGVAFREGIMAIASGMYDVVLVGGIEKMSSVSTDKVQEYLATASDVPIETSQAAFTFPGLYATMASAYMDRYDINNRHLMEITIKNHENGSKNPMAQLNLSITDIMNDKKNRAEQLGKQIPDWNDEYDFLNDPRSNPMVASPLRLFDCAPITDGSACIILVAEELSGIYSDNQISVVASGQASAGPLSTWGRDITSIPSTKTAAEQAYVQANISPSDIDIAEVHDCFTPAELFAIEDLGFFEPGKGAFATAEGMTAADSDMPINVSGGLKAKGHPVGATGVAQLLEIWKQLTGRAEYERQIRHKDLRLGLTQNVGGTGGTCVIHILEKKT